MYKYMQLVFKGVKGPKCLPLNCTQQTRASLCGTEPTLETTSSAAELKIRFAVLINLDFD